jgi:carbamoyl-phosphate synthase large subunit
MAIADLSIKVPDVYNINYVDTILEICKKENVKALFSLNDLELPILSERKGDFIKIGVNLVVSNEKVIDTCFDKWATKQFAESLGIAVPQTYIDYQVAKAALKSGELNFPLVLKPRWGSASIGLEFPQDLSELDLAFQLLSIKLFRSSLARASHKDPHHAILIQEKIEGKEYGIDILNDFSGKPHQVYVKEKLAMRAGETDKAVLRYKPEIEAIGLKLGEALGHIGNLDCDIFEKDGQYYLLEMNPRFGGGYPFTHMSGGNYPAALVSWLNGEMFDFSTFKRNYNQVFSKCDTLINVLSDE